MHILKEDEPQQCSKAAAVSARFAELAQKLPVAGELRGLQSTVGVAIIVNK